MQLVASRAEKRIRELQSVNVGNSSLAMVCLQVVAIILPIVTPILDPVKEI